MLQNILKLNGVTSLSKKTQQQITGSIGFPVASNCNGVFCPTNCHCVSAYNSYCVFTNGTKKGQYCAAL